MVVSWVGGGDCCYVVVEIRCGRPRRSFKLAIESGEPFALGLKPGVSLRPAAGHLGVVFLFRKTGSIDTVVSSGTISSVSTKAALHFVRHKRPRALPGSPREERRETTMGFGRERKWCGWLSAAEGIAVYWRKPAVSTGAAAQRGCPDDARTA